MSTRRTSQRLEDSEAQLLQISTNSPNLRRGSSNLLSGLTTSAEDYLSKIQSHAETSILDSLYPGGHFADISEFLKSRLTSQSRQFPTSLEGSAFLHKIYSKTTASVTSLTTPVSLDEADAYLDIHTPHNSILFLCGYPSAEWIAHVGSKYRVDPEFWRRHAGYLNGNETLHLETRLVLPSACSSIIHLPLVSVASHKIVDGVASEDDVTRHRRNCTRDMGNYRYRLRIGLEWRAGDSIVRDFDVLDKDHFMIEQLASVYITARDEKKTSWIGKCLSSP
ncbi:uncharacterized protein RSE6_07150 [Rhynchosporium secalis]|uniref:Uncharacterized protein n=1 Tax=Rhynchosporium secalis TaxID=38038 RepID=A0A1E1MD76_RHYSE|nr:uncharacterized protein RSE6_07150 [Rhynchosporium secalis]